jgi:hypothetical protein
MEEIFKPQETDSPQKEQAIAIGIRYVPLNASLKDFLESYIHDLNNVIVISKLLNHFLSVLHMEKYKDIKSYTKKVNLKHYLSAA